MFLRPIEQESDTQVAIYEKQRSFWRIWCFKRNLTVPAAPPLGFLGGEREWADKRTGFGFYWTGSVLLARFLSSLRVREVSGVVLFSLCLRV